MCTMCKHDYAMDVTHDYGLRALQQPVHVNTSYLDNPVFSLLFGVGSWGLSCKKCASSKLLNKRNPYLTSVAYYLDFGNCNPHYLVPNCSAINLEYITRNMVKIKQLCLSIGSVRYRGLWSQKLHFLIIELLWLKHSYWTTH